MYIRNIVCNLHSRGIITGCVFLDAFNAGIFERRAQLVGGCVGDNDLAYLVKADRAFRLCLEDVDRHIVNVKQQRNYIARHFIGKRIVILLEKRFHVRGANIFKLRCLHKHFAYRVQFQKLVTVAAVGNEVINVVHELGKPAVKRIGYLACFLRCQVFQASFKLVHIFDALEALGNTCAQTFNAVEAHNVS